MFCSPQHSQQSIPIVPEEACKIPALYLIAVTKNKHVTEGSCSTEQEHVTKLSF